MDGMDDLVSPKKRYNSEIVIPKGVNQGTVIEKALTTDDRSDEDTEHEDNQGEENEVQQSNNQQRMALKDLYFVALELRENIQANSASWFNDYPPLASEKTGDSVRKVMWSFRLFSILLCGC